MQNEAARAKGSSIARQGTTSAVKPIWVLVVPKGRVTNIQSGKATAYVTISGRRDRAGLDDHQRCG